jgi:hypothetical protein
VVRKERWGPDSFLTQQQDHSKVSDQGSDPCPPLPTTLGRLLVLALPHFPTVKCG